MTVIVELPSLKALTVPLATETTEEFEEDQLTFLLVALAGVTVAIKVELWPTVKEILVEFKETSVTATLEG